VAALFLIADDLCGRQPARGVDFRNHDQGRRLYRVEALAASVRGRGRRIGAVVGEWLLYGGMATVAFGTIGTLASQDMAELGAFSVLLSSGTLLAAIGIGQAGLTAGVLFYIVSSTLGIGAFFLLVELMERGREPGAGVLAVTREAYGEDDGGGGGEHEDEAGLAVPVTMGMLALAFIGCALMIAGLPPLSGFIAKFALLTAALNSTGMPQGGGPVSAASWALLVALILSGLAGLIAMTRAGIRAFWAAPDRAMPRVGATEMAPIAALLSSCACFKRSRPGRPCASCRQPLTRSMRPGTTFARYYRQRNNKHARRAGHEKTTSAFPTDSRRAVHPLAAAQSSAYVEPYRSCGSSGACRRLGIDGAAAAKSPRPAAWHHPPFVITCAGRHRAFQHRRKPNYPRSSKRRTPIALAKFLLRGEVIE
jgi:hypothetical protein